MQKVILLNGAIRDVEEIYLIIDYVYHVINKAKTHVDVVISTWHEDVESNPELFKWMAGLGVKVVGSRSLNHGGPANIYRQWRTMEAGVDLISRYYGENAIVLKGRTDKFLLRKDVVESFVSVDLDANVMQDLIASEKLALEHISVSLPFMAKDMVYLGTLKAMRKVLHYSVRTKLVADNIYNGIGPECFLWLEFARDDSAVMGIIQTTDLRFLSNKIVDMEQNFIINTRLDKKPLSDLRWDNLSKKEIYLYQKWFIVFEREFCFLTDVLPCQPLDPWIITEGIWKYITGGRPEFDEIKGLISCESVAFVDVVDNYINSTLEYHFDDKGEYEISASLKSEQDNIYNNTSREYSDIVLIRSKIIKTELASTKPNCLSLKKSIYWNIKQRDRTTLEMVYNWILSKDEKLKYVDRSEQVFVIERMLDFFTFSQDHVKIKESISKIPYYYATSPSLRTRLAEYYFSKRQLLRALYWFYRAYKDDNKSLGACHGLGSTLLDLRLPKLALKYLRLAHNISPNDQTALFTLLKALIRSGKKDEAYIVFKSLSGELKHEAERLLK